MGLACCLRARSRDLDDDDGEVRQMFTTGKKAVYSRFLFVRYKEGGNYSMS